MKAIVYLEDKTHIEYDLKFHQSFGCFGIRGWKVDYNKFFDWIYREYGYNKIRKVVFKND